VKDANSKTRTEIGIRTIDLDGSVEMNDSESLFVLYTTASSVAQKSLHSKVSLSCIIRVKEKNKA
jgi:hypothetical protein